jgi:hypothetical protein
MSSIIVISIITILGLTELFKQTFNTVEGFQYRYRWLTPLLSKIDFKPINCAYCLSFWTGLLFSIVFLDVTYMSIFLFYVLKSD